MKINSNIGILRFLKKKVVRLCIMGTSLVGLTVSSTLSFAKYRDEYYGGGNAGTAKFGSWLIESENTPIDVPNNARSGWYAFLATFSLSFSTSEVDRSYTLKIKAINHDENVNDFNNSKVADNFSFYLSENVDVYTISRSENNGVITSEFKDTNFSSTLMNGSSLSFSSDKIYYKYDETHGSIPLGQSWMSYSVNSTNYDTDTNSLILANDHLLDSNEGDFHHYYIIYFVKIDQSKSVNDIKFIYNLDVRQVI